MAQNHASTREGHNPVLIEARYVVEKLAEQDAPLMDGTYANGHDWCVLCSGEGPRPEAHDADCPWRMARQYMEYDRIGGTDG